MTDSPYTVDELHSFFETYYQDELEEFATIYPERRRFEIRYDDVWRWEMDTAKDWLDNPEQVSEWFTDALNQYAIGTVNFTDAYCRLVNLPEEEIYSPMELRNEQAGEYIGVSGELSRVTTPDDKAELIAFECKQCGDFTKIPQPIDELREPRTCDTCDKKGPFDIIDDHSIFVDFSRVRIETPPENAGNQGSESVDGYVAGELVEMGHDDGLIQRAGDRATLYGQIERVPKMDGNKKTSLFTRRFAVEAIEFDSERETIDVEEHRDEFERLASRDDAVELFKQSIAPELFATDAWQVALELGVAYLFGAPRLNVPDGPTYRGDIHALLVTDYAMGKSTFNEGIEEYSPKCINKSATGLSSDVGLLAAAVKDDFGDGQWTIKPGILVRGNGGHVILDEIDKPDAKLSRMNDALEGQQKIDIEKAGQSVTYQSRVGLMATGNPEDSRYDDHTAISDQIGINETLLSRFDGIVTMRDTADEDTDAKIAERIIDGIVEASEYVGSERSEFDILERPVSVDVGQAWIKYARENVDPVASKDVFIEIRDWYATEVRQLNKTMGGDGDGSDMPVPVTARVVEDAYRFAASFARLHLRDEIAEQDVERAKDLVKQLVSQSWSGDAFVDPRQSQVVSVEKIYSYIRRNEAVTIDDIIENSGIADSDAERYVEKLLNQGRIMEPERGKYRTV